MRLCRCGKPTKKKLCEDCKPTWAEKSQGTTKERGYGHDWRRFSERQRDKNPLCVVHEARGIVRPATELHHVEKVRDAPERRLDVHNTVAVCMDCHREIEGMGHTELHQFLERLEKQQ